MDIIIFSGLESSSISLKNIMDGEGHKTYLVCSDKQLTELVEFNKFIPDALILHELDIETIISVHDHLKIMIESLNKSLYGIAVLKSEDQGDIFRVMSHNIDVFMDPINQNYLIAKINMLGRLPFFSECANLKSNCFLHKQSIEKQEFISHQIAMIHNAIVSPYNKDLKEELVESYLSVLDDLKGSVLHFSIFNELNSFSDFSILSYIKTFFSTYKVNIVKLDLPESGLFIKVNKLYFVIALNKILMNFIRNASHQGELYVNYGVEDNKLSFEMTGCNATQLANLDKLLENDFLIDVLQLNSCYLSGGAQNSTFYLSLFLQREVKTRKIA